MKLTREEILKYIDMAIEVRENAYTPYSMFKVGAVVIGDNGNVVRGANIENASYGLSNCAERSAIFSALSQGVKKLKG